MVNEPRRADDGTDGRVVLIGFGVLFVLLLGIFFTVSWQGRDPIPPIKEIHCQRQIRALVHFVFTLALYDRGRPVPVPAGIGHREAAGCTYWLHTDDASGRVWVDAPEQRTFSLADFFAVWGQPLSPQSLAGRQAGPGETVRAWVDGRPFSGSFSDLTLSADQHIVVALGPPWPRAASPAASAGGSSQ